MNKGLLKIALLSMVCASMPAAITSCKDYDDDIDTLGQKDQDLANQIKAIDEKINELRSLATEAKNNADQALKDAAAAKAAGDEALRIANEAKHEAELAKQAAATAKAEALEEIKAELAKYTKLEDTEKLQARVKALEEALAKLTPGTGGTSYDEAIQALQTQLNALNIYKELLANLAGKEELLNGLQQTITEINAAIEGLKSQTSGFDTTLKTISDRVAALEGNLVTINGDELRALVFNPVFYYHGIEAMWAPTWAYLPLDVKAVDADGEYATDAPVAGKDSVFMTPDLIAEYHMNPSTADMPEDVKAYSFTNTIKTVEFVRSAGVPAPTIDSIGFENGIVEVRANLKNGILPYIAKDSKVTVLALQVNLGDTVITSDYAALKPQYSYGFALNEAKENEKHLPTTMEEAMAISPKDAIAVAWNSTGINIAELVNTHYWTDESRAAGKDNMWDVNATKETVRRDGFDYSYELVGYHLGENTTSESAHAALKVEGNNCILRPQMTKDGKQQAYSDDSKTQGMSTIDRMPIVRVVLKDTVSGKNAAVGYLKFVIVPDTKEDENTVIDPFIFEDGYTAQCPLQPFDDELTWWQVEEKIIEKLGISKMEFEEQYKPDYVAPQELFPGATATSPVYVLKQFDKAGKGAKELARTAWIGVAGKTEYDQPAAETEVIKWKIDGEQAYKLFVDQKKTSTSVTVRFFKEEIISMGSNHTQKVYHYVYVTLTWTPKPLNVTPAGEIVNGIKIPEMWYTAWTNNHGGFDETHLNVNVPGNNSVNPAECVYQSYLLYPWVNEMVTFSNINTIYKGYEDANLDKYFTFDQKVAQQTAEGVSGAKYNLTVSTDGLTLNATMLGSDGKPSGAAQAVAIISNNKFDNSMIATDPQPVVTYQETAYAKDILSTYNHKQLAEGETLAAKIVITANNQCEKPIAISNNTYNVRFLRPVNMDVKGTPEMVDALNDGSTIKLADFLSFTDWRSDDPMSFFSTHANYYKYYGLESIKVGYVNKSNPALLNAVASGKINDVVTTTLGNGTLGETVLSNVAPSMDLIYTPASTLDNTHMGTLTYYNRRETTNKPFKVRVPLVLTYKWGYLTGTLDITINPTIGNSEL